MIYLFFILNHQINFIFIDFNSYLFSLILNNKFIYKKSIFKVS